MVTSRRDPLLKIAKVGIFGVRVPDLSALSLDFRKAVMPVDAAPTSTPATAADLAKSVQPFTRPDRKKATWQIINTLVPFFALWALMVEMVRQGYPYGSVLAVSVIAAAFQVRIFILFHDCCH
jgi:fatty acid desaturase